MQVAKLSTGEIVRFLKYGVPDFSGYEMALVSKRLTINPRRTDPYWVPATQVIWIMDWI